MCSFVAVFFFSVCVIVCVRAVFVVPSAGMCTLVLTRGGGTKPHVLTRREETIAVHRFTPSERSSWLQTDGVRQQHVTAVKQEAASPAVAAVLVLVPPIDVWIDSVEDCCEFSSC